MIRTIWRSTILSNYGDVILVFDFSVKRHHGTNDSRLAIDVELAVVAGALFDVVANLQHQQLSPSNRSSRRRSLNAEHFRLFRFSVLLIFPVMTGPPKVAQIIFFFGGGIAGANFSQAGCRFPQPTVTVSNQWRNTENIQWTTTAR